MTPRFSVLVTLLLVVLAGCGSSPSVGTSATGAMRLAITLLTAAPGDVSRVTVTVTGSDMASQSTDLTLGDGAWSGVLGDIPAGARRTFLAQAFTPSNTLRYEGRAENVTVTAGTTGQVSLTLQDVSTPPPFTNEAPLVESLVATPTTVAPGGGVSLSVSARDPNAGDTLSYEWSAPSGSFSAPTQASTSWTAPTMQGPVRLSLTVRDSRGAALTVSLTVTVSAGSGAEEIKVDFNTAPRVLGLTSSQSLLDVGQTTALTVSASDSDGDNLSYQWSTTCPGTLAGASTASATFTPLALPSAACNNCQVSVTVKDGRDGQNTGSLSLCVSKGAVLRSPPTVTHSHQSSLTTQAGQQLTFEVGASDPTGSALTFAWRANGGTLGTANSEATRGHISWTAPACVGKGMTPSITATVTNALGLEATRLFTVTGLPTCTVATWTPSGSLNIPRRQHMAVLLPNGKVLITGGSNGQAVNNMKTELYDPVTDTWSLTGSLARIHDLATATLLPDGKVLVAGGDTVAPEVYDPVTGTWSSTGAMVAIRFGHTATLLPNGQVLAVGGSYGSDLATAEVYDPATGTWSPTGAMLSARSGHTATLLPDGKVLVAAGRNNNDTDYRATAEVYDPATGTWSPTGAMVSARTNHTATLLPSGKVLVSGGQISGNPLATVEVYDPATGTWSPTASLTSARTNHTATRLPDGTVLVAGGYSISSNGNLYLAVAEVYDPATDTWTPTASLVAETAWHTATRMPNGTVLVVGGVNSRGLVKVTQVYDPATDVCVNTTESSACAPGSWTPTRALATPRQGPTATLLPNGMVLVSGGRKASGPLATAEVYDPATGTWSPTSPLASARSDHTATLLPNGTVLVSGGHTGSGLLATTEVYDPATGRWSPSGPLASARSRHTATLLPSGKVLVSGGQMGSKPLATAEVYDPATGRWSPTGSLTSARTDHTATRLPDGKVLVSGGYASDSYLATAEVYDPTTGRWSPTGSLATARNNHTATLLPDGKVLVSGGYTPRSFLATAEVYDPATGRWSPTGSLATARNKHTATRLPDGKVLVSGGNGHSYPLATAEVYDPATGTWTPIRSMYASRFQHTATLLPNGAVLVAGGGSDYAIEYLATAEIYTPLTGN